MLLEKSNFINKKKKKLLRDILFSNLTFSYMEEILFIY